MDTFITTDNSVLKYPHTKNIYVRWICNIVGTLLVLHIVHNMLLETGCFHVNSAAILVQNLSKQSFELLWQGDIQKTRLAVVPKIL